MRITLRDTAGPHKGREFSFVGHDTFIVGRSKRAHFRLSVKDKYFSRIHFLVEVNPPHCRVTDLGSRNGTFVNGQRVQVADLKDGDRIQGGRTVLRIAIDDSVSLVVPPPQAGSSQEAASVHIVGTPKPPGSDRDPLSPSRPSAGVPVPAPARGGAVAPQPRRPPMAAPLQCRACEALGTVVFLASPSDRSDPNPPQLCPACQELVRKKPQPIPGYQIVGELGRGAMGIVHLAVRTADWGVVALKTIIPAVAGLQRDIDRFLREASLLRELNHPNIVGFREMGEANGQLYFAMEFVRGDDAHRLLKTDGPMPIRRAVALVCQVLEALEYAQAKGIVHRDIKPANILVTEVEGRDFVKLADFGLGRVYQTSRLSGLTMQGDIGGTLPFMAPEQILKFR